MEHSDIVSLKVPAFRHGHLYWDLFSDLYEFHNILLIGLFSYNIKTQGDKEADEFLRDFLSKPKEPEEDASLDLGPLKEEMDSLFQPVPVLVMNPPARQKVESGDYLLALGRVDPELLKTKLFEKKVQKGKSSAFLKE